MLLQPSFPGAASHSQRPVFKFHPDCIPCNFYKTFATYIKYLPDVVGEELREMLLRSVVHNGHSITIRVKKTVRTI